MPKTYTFVLIPEDAAAPMQTVTCNEADFEDDELRAHVRAAFTAKLGSPASAPTPGKAADTMDITLLTTPTAAVGFVSESLYSPAGGQRVNARASALARACGHTDAQIMGDAYLGRCVDDERGDRWFRVSVTTDEAQPSAPWVVATAAANRGKNLNTYSSGGLQAAWAGMSAGTPAPSSSGLGADAAPSLTATWADALPAHGVFTWRQSGDEVEVRMPVPAGTRAKDVVVSLTSHRVGVALRSSSSSSSSDVAGGLMARLGGSDLFAAVDTDESSWQLEDAGAGGRMLVLTLATAGRGGAWPAVFRE